jgi:hypothetical protein
MALIKNTLFLVAFLVNYKLVTALGTTTSFAVDGILEGSAATPPALPTCCRARTGYLQVVPVWL